MADIKTRKVIKDTIKKLDRTAIYTEKIKDNMVNIKDKSNYNDIESNSPNEYGGNKISQSTDIIFGKNKNNQYYFKKSVVFFKSMI